MGEMKLIESKTLDSIARFFNKNALAFNVAD